MNLQVCDNGHDEITYYGAYKDCPFCKYIKEQEDIQDEKEEVERDYEDKCEECEKLGDKIEDLECKVADMELALEELRRV